MYTERVTLDGTLAFCNKGSCCMVTGSLLQISLCHDRGKSRCGFILLMEIVTGVFGG